MNSKIWDMDTEKLHEWLEARPKIIKTVCRKYPPHLMYKLNNRSYCTIVAYYEDGTVRVNICNFFNRGDLFERDVFNVNPNDLVECDIPI